MRIIQVILAILLISAITLTIIGVINREWRTTTASISLMVALISAWMASETFRKQELAKKPQIVIDFDLESRYRIIQLSIKNYGERPAFNIKIDWKQKLTNSSNREIIFNKTGNINYDIPVLNRNEKLNLLIDKDEDMFKAYPEGSLIYSGTITYQESLNTKSRRSQDFYISLEHYRKTTDNSSQIVKANHEIPKYLKEIKEELSKLSNKMNKPSA